MLISNLLWIDFIVLIILKSKGVDMCSFCCFSLNDCIVKYKIIYKMLFLWCENGFIIFIFVSKLE